MMKTENGILPTLQCAVPHHHTVSPYGAVIFRNVSVIPAAPCIILFILLFLIPFEFFLGCFRLIEEMTCYYGQNLSKEVENKWEIGGICAVFRMSDKRWYRGLVTSVKSNCYKVQYTYLNI